MKQLLAIGEALVDFIPQNTNCSLKDIKSFMPKVGGAPLNVLGAYAKLGGKTKLLTMVGKDAYGAKIIEYLEHYGIDASGIRQTAKQTTPLAFVSYNNNEREFFFTAENPAYSKYQSKYIKESDFIDTYAIHFCSVALKNGPMLKATQKALNIAKDNNVFISFDLNLRPQMYNDDKLLKNRVFTFLPQCNILKISDDEFSFLFPQEDPIETLPKLLGENLKLILYTAGSGGSMAVTKSGIVEANSFKALKIQDTTGAGDGFIGSFLYQIAKDDINDLTNISLIELEKYLKFSNMFSAISLTKKGAINSYPSYKTVIEHLSKYN